MDTWVLIAIGGAGVVLVVVGLTMIAAERRQRGRLKETFGPEYHRAVAGSARRREAERELVERKRRHDRLDIRPLSSAARERFRDDWQSVQTRFVDDPEGAARSADALVARLMEERGYPAHVDAERRAADLSVEHAHVVGQYRRGQALLADLDDSEDATESLRQAMKCFRTAFEELLEDHELATF
jgi:type I site-specific restriction endonuclease